MPQDLPETHLTVIGLDAWHGISNWRSTHAPGQPFGVEQTTFGAVNRMKECWKKATEYMQSACTHLFVVGFENGLVEGREIGKDPGTWYDMCVTAVAEVFSKSGVAIDQGASVPTEFGTDTSMTFDEQVVQYHKLIMPKVESKTDLYLEWTKHLEGGPFTRAHFLKNSLTSSLAELLMIQKAKGLVLASAKDGVVASLGPRYKNMHWMRDLAYMAPAFLMLKEREALIDALRTLCKEQCQIHALYDNGYEQFNRFGNMPIVAVSEKGQKGFLLQRLRGTQEDPYWQIQLWNYCKQRNALSEFPAPAGMSADSEPPSLSDCTLVELRSYYTALLQFTEQLARAQDVKPSGPSFALRAFMESTLGNLTPGTHDSEIHFIRALCAIAQEDDTELVVQEFAKPLACAFFYLYMNVVDPQDALPKGCDSRDIFADMLYDAKTLTNALFLYDALHALQKIATMLETTAFREAIIEAIQSSSGIVQKHVPEILQKLSGPKTLSCGEIISQELHKVKMSIKDKLLFKDDTFSPRDFIPGARAVLSISHPVTPSPANHLITAYNPGFVSGEEIDPQSLALAVLFGLVPEQHYEQVIKYFKEEDTPIGISVFVPISGKTEEETALLKRVQGRVVWPHIGWTVYRALIVMNTVESKQMACEQRKKLMKLGVAEWYAFIDGATIQGGDPEQGWSASSMLLAAEECYSVA